MNGAFNDSSTVAFSGDLNGPDAAILAIILPFIGIILVLALVFYVLGALGTFWINTRFKEPAPWLAWIPFGNLYSVVKAAGLHGAWAWAVLVAFVPVVGPLAVTAGSIYLVYATATRLQYSTGHKVALCILSFLVSPIIYFVMGLKAKKLPVAA